LTETTLLLLLLGLMTMMMMAIATLFADKQGRANPNSAGTRHSSGLQFVACD
jgi:hypothetical protein